MDCGQENHVALVAGDLAYHDRTVNPGAVVALGPYVRVVVGIFQPAPLFPRRHAPGALPILPGRIVFRIQFHLVVRGTRSAPHIRTVCMAIFGESVYPRVVLVRNININQKQIKEMKY